MLISTNTKIRLTMLCLSGFELYSRWVPLKNFTAPHRMHLYGSKITLDSLTSFIHVYRRKTPLGAPVWWNAMPEASGNFNWRTHTRKFKRFRASEPIPGVVLPIMAYTGRFCAKGFLLFSGFSYRAVFIWVSKSNRFCTVYTMRLA